LCLVAITPLANTLTRIFCDPSLKSRFWKKHSQSVDSLLEQSKQNSEMTESLLDPMNAGPIFPKRPPRQSGQIYDRLTQNETLNNLLSTFTGICLLMDEVYDLFQDNMLSTDIVDLLAASEFMSEEVYNKKFSKVYRLDDLAQRFPRSENPAHAFPPELEKNVQKGLQFKITEYSTLIFQNLRIRQRDK
jgi:hypothetical protein